MVITRPLGSDQNTWVTFGEYGWVSFGERRSTSHLLANGVPLPVVSARLGHSSIRTTQEIYAHMITGQDDEAAQKWEEFQRKNTLTREAKEIQ
ncbi:MAG: tyrosine-type recombinase/integrase [Candidatus Solibacter sp.]